jgi:hypothetical protein
VFTVRYETEFLNFLEFQASRNFQKDKQANAGNPNECSFANQGH